MKTVEVFFSKRFTLRDDQPDTEPVKSWTRDMGLTYVSHRRITGETNTSFSFDDLVRYICTGQATPEIDAYFRSVSSKSPVPASPESEDQPDGAGAHWR